MAETRSLDVKMLMRWSAEQAVTTARSSISPRSLLSCLLQRVEMGENFWIRDAGVAIRHGDKTFRANGFITLDTANSESMAICSARNVSFRAFTMGSLGSTIISRSSSSMYSGSLVLFLFFLAILLIALEMACLQARLTDLHLLDKLMLGVSGPVDCPSEWLVRQI